MVQNLTASQAKAFAQAIRENQKFEKTLAQIRSILLKILKNTRVNHRRRKEKSPSSQEIMILNLVPFYGAPLISPEFEFGIAG